MPISLCDLPSDILRFKILPCLEYESRINLNRLLLPDERFTRRIPYKKIVRHIMIIRKRFFKQIKIKMFIAVGLKNTIMIWRDYCHSLLRNRMINLVPYYKQERSSIEGWLTYFERQIIERSTYIPEDLEHDILEFTKRIRAHFEKGWANPTSIGQPFRYRVS